jgi:hypothetical protein
VSSFSQLPARMNVTLKAGDKASTSVDFDVSLSAFTVTSQITSLVTGQTVANIATTVTNAGAGQVSLAFPATLSPGSYGWQMLWTSSDGGKRTVLSGVAEYVP